MSIGGCWLGFWGIGLLTFFQHEATCNQIMLLLHMCLVVTFEVEISCSNPVLQLHHLISLKMPN